MKNSQVKKLWVSLMLLAAISMTVFVISASAAEVKSDIQIVGDLGLLKGDGDGLTQAYLAKPTLRIQAAILFLRLNGLEAVALAHTGTDSFSDANLVSDSNKAILAYLKANPSLGWIGMGDNKFDPLAVITAQQVYKVLLETLGYKQNSDFMYSEVFTFGSTMGLNQLAKMDQLKNVNIATAIVEAMQMKGKGSTKTLLQMLIELKLIDATKADFATYKRVNFMASDSLGKYLVDANGKALYTFTKDTANTSNCALGACLTKWPVFYAEKLMIPAGLDAADFGVITRTEGTMQTTYKGMPLYYYAMDMKAGDVLGENVGTVWFSVKAPVSVMVKTSADLGPYLTDASGMALYYFDKDPKGSSVCKGNCVVNWPLFYSDYTVVGSGLMAMDFGVITREDGRKQSTYKGFPLYYYIKDLKPGDVIGQNVGKIWFVIDPAKFDGTSVSKGITAPASTPAPAPMPMESPAPTSTSVVKPEMKNYVVEMVNYSFKQAEITIGVGSTVTFTNKDDSEHNAVAVDGSFTTPLIGKGVSKTVTFTKAGEFEYYCEPHKDIMKGKIIVK